MLHFFEKLSRGISSQNGRFYVLVFFLAAVFLMGGSSRGDVQSLVLLRPVAIIMAAYALCFFRREYLSAINIPLYIIILLAAIITLQLIPMPPEWWRALPQREIYAEIARDAGLQQPWRPLSLSPSRSWNSLFSLTIPLAALLLYAIQDDRKRKQVIPVIIIFGAISAFWSLLQIAGPQQGPLYLYRISNAADPVGLFANRNHQAVFLAAMITMLGWYLSSIRGGDRQKQIKQFTGFAGMMLLVPLIFIVGSRAGFIVALLASAGLFYFLITSERFKIVGDSKEGGIIAWLIRHQVALFFALFIVLGVVSVLLSRSEALDRLLASDDVTEMRVALTPILFNLVGDYFPFGSGFGSFEFVYMRTEPTELLSPKYLNQAHNDWLQLPIEGGLPATLLVMAGVFWFFVKSVKAFLEGSGRQKLAVFVILFFAIASIVDYPLRTPIYAAVFAIFCAVLNGAGNVAFIKKAAERSSERPIRGAD